MLWFYVNAKFVKSNGSTLSQCLLENTLLQDPGGNQPASQPPSKLYILSSSSSSSSNYGRPFIDDFELYKGLSFVDLRRSIKSIVKHSWTVWTTSLYSSRYFQKYIYMKSDVISNEIASPTKNVLLRCERPWYLLTRWIWRSDKIARHRPLFLDNQVSSTRIMTRRDATSSWKGQPCTLVYTVIGKPATHCRTEKIYL